MTSRRAVLAGGFLVALIAAVYFGIFVGYGYHLGEDGDVVYLIYRTFSGQRPYVDFASGYTPGHYYFNAELLHLFGADIRVLRWSLVAVNGAALVALYLLGARALPPVLAAAPPLAYAALMPVYRGEFATFNIPYPAWHVVLFWIASLLAFLRFRQGGQRFWIFLAGALAALGCAFKPNTGAFNLAALGLLAAATASPGKCALDRVVWIALLAGVIAAIAATFGFRLVNRDARLLLWPVFGIALAIAAGAPQRFRQPGDGRFTGDAVALLLGFALLTAPWAGFFLLELGKEKFLRDVLFIGSGHELFFYLPIRGLGVWDAGLALAALGLAAAWLVPTARRPSPRVLGLAAAALLAVAIGFVAWAPMPEGFRRAAVQRFEFLAWGAALIVHWSGVALIHRRLRQTVEVRPRARDAELAILISAPLLFLSVYPRSDFFHWVLSAPLTLLAGVLLFWRVARPWLAVRAAPAWAAAPLYAAVLLVWWPGLALAARLYATPATAMANLGLEHAPVALEGGRARRVSTLRQTVDYVRDHTEPGDTVLGFPNLHLINFLSGRQVPGRFGSFNPGWPDHVIEAQIVDDLERRQTPLVIVSQSRQLYIGSAPLYYFLLRDYLRRNYSPTARVGDYHILERNGRSGGTVAAESPPAAVPLDCAAAIRALEDAEAEDTSPLAPCWRKAGDDEQARAVALVRAGRDPAAALALAAALRDGTLGPRSSLLAARAIGESGDARAVPVLIEALPQLDGRTRDELTTALLNIAIGSFFQSHHLDAVDQGRDELASSKAAGLAAMGWLASDDPRLQFAGAWLAGLRRQRELAPAVRRLLEHPSLEFQAVAAEALIDMGDDAGVAEKLIDGMSHDENMFPPLLLRWSEAHPAEARSLLAARFASGNALQRESIAFVAGALGDSALAPAIRDGITDKEWRVRAASIWAAGVLDDEPARTAIAAAEKDPVDQVRSFAVSARARLDRAAAARSNEVKS